MVVLNVGQKVTLAANPLASDGATAKVESSEWSSEGTAGLVLQVDGLSCTVWAQSPGVATVSCTVDADLGSGVKNIVGGLGITVLDETARSLVIQVGEIS